MPMAINIKVGTRKGNIADKVSKHGQTAINTKAGGQKGNIMEMEYLQIKVLLILEKK